MSACIDPRAMEYASAVVELITIEIEASNIPKVISSLPVLFLQSIVTESIEWVSDVIKLRKTNHSLFTVSIFYRVLVVFFYSHTYCLSPAKAVDTLPRLARYPPTLPDVRYILTPN